MEEKALRLWRKAKRRFYLRRSLPYALTMVMLMGGLIFFFVTPSPNPKEVQDLHLQIQKTNAHILVTWEGDPQGTYELQKCILTPGGLECQNKIIVRGNRYPDIAREESPLVVYRVNPHRS